MCLKAVGRLLGLRSEKYDPRNDAMLQQLEEQRKQAKIMAQEAAAEKAKLKEERLEETIQRKRKGVGRRSLIMSGSAGEGFLPGAIRQRTDG